MRKMRCAEGDISPGVANVRGRRTCAVNSREKRTCVRIITRPAIATRNLICNGNANLPRQVGGKTLGQSCNFDFRRTRRFTHISVPVHYACYFVELSTRGVFYAQDFPCETSNTKEKYKIEGIEALLRIHIYLNRKKVLASIKCIISMEYIVPFLFSKGIMAIRHARQDWWGRNNQFM